MQKNNRSRARKSSLGRYARITEWLPSLSVRIDKSRGRLPERVSSHCIQFKAQLEEPVKGLTLIDGMIFPDEVDRYPSVVDPSIGSITFMRDCIQLGVTLTPQEYAWLLTMVAGNLLGACYLSFSQPGRGRAIVYSITFDKDLPPSDER